MVLSLFATWLVTFPAQAANADAGQFVPVRSARLLSGTIGEAAETVVVVEGRGGVPASGVSAVVVNLTAVRPTAPRGFLTVYPDQTQRPVTSALNYVRGEVRSNGVTVPLGFNGALRLYNNAGSTGIYLDVVGYYLSGSASATGTDFVPLTTSIRALDTRLSGQRAVGAGETRQVPIDLGAANADVVAVAVNVTVTNPSAAGSVTVWTGPSAPPSTPLITFVKDQTVANNTVVGTRRVSGVPTIATLNDASGTTQLVVDVVGYYTSDASAGGLRYRRVSPVRILDTRPGDALGPKQSRSFPPPSDQLTARTRALITNLTLVAPTASTYLTAWGAGSRPPTSSVNATAGQTVPNSAIIPATRNVGYQIYNFAGQSDVLVDLAGTFEEPQRDLQSFTVTPDPLPSLPVGTTAQLQVTGRYADGSTADLTDQVRYSVSGGQVSVSDGGLVTARAVGRATITASLDGVASDPVPVLVVAAAVRSLRVTPSTASGTVGQSGVRLTATATLTDGTTQDVSDDATWSSGDTDVATVDDEGRLTLLAPGETPIVASLQGKSDSATVRVTARPRQVVGLTADPSDPAVVLGDTGTRIRITANYDDGTSADVTDEVSFTSSDSSVATVDSTGRITPRGTGTTTITASLDGFIVQTVVTVLPATITALAIRPASADIPLGVTGRRVSAYVTYSDGVEAATNAVDYTSSAPGVVTVSDDGTLTTVATGTAQIRAVLRSNPSITAMAKVTVVPAVITALAVTPASQDVPVGVTGRSVSVEATYSDGSTRAVTTGVIWASSNPAVVAVSATGGLTARQTGSVTITARVAGQTATATVAGVPAILVSIVLSPSAPQLPLGTSTALTAIATYSDGSTIGLGTAATWISSNPAVATVDAAGTVRAAGIGTASIQASAAGRTASAQVRVGPAATTGLAVSVSPSTIAPGGTAQGTATAELSDGTTRAITTAVSWSSSNTGVVTVNGNGVVTAVGRGQASVIARYDGKQASAVVTVADNAVVGVRIAPAAVSVALGQTAQVRATAVLADGTTRDVTDQATWTTGSAQVATVTDGKIQAVGVGSTTVTATYAGRSATVPVTVGPKQLVAVEVSPDALRLPLGSSTVAQTPGQLVVPGPKVLARYSDGTTADVTASATISSSDPNTVRVQGDGSLGAVGRGTATVTVAYGGLRDTVQVSVVDPVVAGLTITPAAPVVAKGSQLQLTATARRSDGTQADVTDSATWSTSDPAVASVTADGRITGVAPGEAVITATVGGVSTTVRVSIVVPVVRLITVTPASATVIRGRTQQFSAVATYTDGSTRDVTAESTWASSDPAVVTVSSSGLATAVAPGTASITATRSGVVSAAAIVTVPPVTVVGVTISGSNAPLPVGRTRALTATARYSDGTTADVTDKATWAATPSGIASVSSAGVVTGQQPGTTTITATVDGVVSQPLTVVIGAKVLDSLQLSPTKVTVWILGVQQYIATAVYSDGTTANVTSKVHWSSSSTSVAEISLGGLVVAVLPGTTVITASLDGQVAAGTLTVVLI